MSLMTMEDFVIAYKEMLERTKDYILAGVDCNCCGEEMRFDESEPEYVFCRECHVQFVDGKFSDMGAKNE